MLYIHFHYYFITTLKIFDKNRLTLSLLLKVLSGRNAE